MQMAYRASKKLNPEKSDTLVRTREEAFKLIAELDKKIADKKLPRHQRAVYLCARAVLYEATGDRKMLDSALEAYNFSKTAQSAALVAVAYHHFGRMHEAIDFYERSYKYPHEAGWEIDIGYSGALLFQPDRWPEAWPIVKSLKKRMVYALYLNFWDGKPCKEVSIISEGGFGDLIQNARYLKKVGELCEKVTVYLPPYFFDTGFVDLLRSQSWFPEIKPMLETPKSCPAAGFFDLPAIFNTTPDTIPDYPAPWVAQAGAHKETIHDLNTGFGRTKRPKIGFCWGARAMETPLVAPGTYRSLSEQQAIKIVQETSDKIDWVSLQLGKQIPGVWNTELKSWAQTAAILENLDAVVTVDTGVMHLAVAMGVPTYVLLSGAVDWKFGVTGQCPWYPKIKLFRNDDFGFEKSVSDLIENLNGEFHNLSRQCCFLR